MKETKLTRSYLITQSNYDRLASSGLNAGELINELLRAYFNDPSNLNQKEIEAALELKRKEARELNEQILKLESNIKNVKKKESVNERGFTIRL